MSQGHPEVGDALSFLDREPVGVAPLRGGASGKTGTGGRWLIRGLFISLHALVVVIALNWAGLLHTPGFDRVKQVLHRATAPEGGAVAGGQGVGPMVKGPGIVVPPSGLRKPIPPAPLRADPPSLGLPVLARRADPPRPNVPATAPAKPGRLSDGRRTEPDPDDGSAAAKAAREAREAEALLASKGLVRNSAAFALKSESDVKTSLDKLRERARESKAAYDQLAAAQMLFNLDHSINEADRSISELDFQMGQYPSTYFRGRWVHGQGMLDEEAYQVLKSQHANVVRLKNSSLIPDRNALRAQHVPSLPRANEAFKGRSESSLAALNETREAVAETRKGYEALANDVEVRKALDRLGRANLAPTPEFQNYVRELGQIEKFAGQKVTYPTP